MRKLRAARRAFRGRREGEGRGGGGRLEKEKTEASWAGVMDESGRKALFVGWLNMRSMVAPVA